MQKHGWYVVTETEEVETDGKMTIAKRRFGTLKKKEAHAKGISNSQASSDAEYSHALAA